MSLMMLLLGAVAIVGLWLAATYNSLVSLRNMMQEGASGMDVQLKRRFDLIPNLVETVKGYAAHEKETLQNVTNARTAVANSGSDMSSRLNAENALTGTLRTLFAVAESYPDLKASENFRGLQEQLSSIENDIQMARRYYNGTVRNLNNGIQKFPAVLVAGAFGFKTAPFFETEEEAKQTPKVSF